MSEPSEARAHAAELRRVLDDIDREISEWPAEFRDGMMAELSRRSYACAPEGYEKENTEPEA